MIKTNGHSRCPDCHKEIRSDYRYRYVLRNAQGDPIYYALEKLASGSFLGFRNDMWHGHFPAPRLITPPPNVWVETLEPEDAVPVVTLVVP